MGGSDLKVELLSFQVSPSEFVKDFLVADSQVWLPWLQRQRGFLHKTSEIYPGGRVELRLFWKTKEDQDRAAASPELQTIELMFRNRIGPIYRQLYGN